MATSLLAGVSGLRTHQTLLDVVGNNLANVNTIGFKGQRVEFQDLLFQTLSRSSATSSNQVGGTNPVQIGLGTRIGSIDTSFQQGNLQATGRDLDLAIQGDGFFVVNDGLQNLYSRAGAFAVDSNNYLVDPASGYRVQRTGTLGEGSATSPAFQLPGENSIRIPFGTGIPGQATNVITFRGNLSATASGPQSATLTTAQPFRSANAPATLATLINNLDSNPTNYVAGDRIRLQGTTFAGTPVNITVPVGPATTMGDLINAINANFTGATASLDATGNLIVRANTTGPSALNLTISDDTAAPPVVGSTRWSDHIFRTTTVGKDGDRVPTAIQVYDTQGTAHTVTLTFQKQANNTWNLSASMSASEGTVVDSTVTGITFNDDGSFRLVSGTGPGDADIAIQFNGIAAPQTLNFFFGDPNGSNGLTQFGGPTSAAAISQDGYSAGFLNSLSVSTDGVLQGVFTNGRSLPIAQLAIANFTNPTGLSREGNNYFMVTANSGLPLVGTALSGGRGAIQRGTLESSNVDTALEFTRLIIAQRGFQVNARTISVSNEVLQELASIIR